MPGIVKRIIESGFDTCLLGFAGREYVKSAFFDATTLTRGGVDEQQVITVTGAPGGGSFKLAYKTYTTGTIAFDAAASVVQAALRALPVIGPNGVDVTGSAGGPYTVTFRNNLGKQDVVLLTADGAGLTGGTSPGVTVTEAVKGNSEYADQYVILPGTILTKTADGKMVKEYTGGGAVNEVQTITITGTPTGGNITLSFDGEVTGNIAHNAAASAVQAALEALANIDVGDVAVTGGPGPGTPWVVTFGGQYAGRSVPQIGANSALTGGSSPAVGVATTTQGAESSEEIFGIFDGFVDVMSNTAAASPDIPVYNQNCTFDQDKIRNFSTHEAALRAWGSDRGCTFEQQQN